MMEWYTWLMLALVFPGMPILGITMAIRDERKFIASYPPKYQALAKQSSDEMWPRGVLDQLIELHEMQEGK